MNILPCPVFLWRPIMSVVYTSTYLYILMALYLLLISFCCYENIVGKINVLPILELLRYVAVCVGVIPDMWCQGVTFCLMVTLKS